MKLVMMGIWEMEMDVHLLVPLKPIGIVMENLPLVSLLVAMGR